MQKMIVEESFWDVLPDARNAVLVMESVDPARADDLQAAFDEFAQLMERYLGAEVRARQILTREQPEMVLLP